MDIVEYQSIFEYELKRKLAQRSRSPQEELRKLLSAFKFFDYTSSFILDKNQWIKGIQRTGLCGFNVNDLANVFDRYDPNKTGYINYMNFSNYLYGKEELIPISSEFGNGPKNNDNNNNNNIYNNRNTQNYKNNNEFKPPGLYERNFDDVVNKSQLSHYNNSESTLNDFNINNNNNNTNLKNSNGNINNPNINFNNNPNPNPNQNNNEISKKNIIQPKNYHITKSQSQILSKVKKNILDENNNFNNNQNINNANDVNNNNKNNNNHISESKNYFEKLVNIFRNKINTNNGITYYTFVHALKTLEDKSTKSVNIESLMSIIEQMSLDINQDDLINFYSILDYTQSNKVSTNELIRIIKGEIPEKRKILIVSKFAVMDKEKTGFIPIMLVKKLYNAKFHPDAFLGKKPEEDVYKEFLYTFDIFCDIYELKEEISYKDFVDYYTPISSSILNDNYFDDIIYGVWNIDNKVDDTNKNNININNNIDLNENKGNESYDKRNNYDININNINNNNTNNNILSKSQNINRDIRNTFSPNVRMEKMNRQKMTPYYNPRASPEGKGLKMFRRLRYNPLTNEYIMSPIPPEKEENLIFDRNVDTNNNINNNIVNNNIDINVNNNNVNNNINMSGLEKINLLRDLLARRGQKSIFIIQRMLYIYDQDQTGIIPLHKLCDIFEIYNINLAKEDIFDIFNIFDKERKGIIKYNDLIQLLISNINEKREMMIQNLFEKMHKGNGYVLINDLKQSFNSMKHPDSINQIRNQEEIYADFLDSLQIFREYYGNLNNDNIKKGIMLYEDFCTFFKEISLSIDDDMFFEYYLNNCFVSDNNNIIKSNNNYGNENNNVRIRTGKQIIDGL